MNHKTVLITGASGNLGKSLAINFAKEEMNIVLTARNIDKLQTVIKKLEEMKANFVSVKLDTNIYSDCENAVKTGIEKFGKIDFVINNASGYLNGWDLRKFSIEEIDVEINTTYKGTIFMTKVILDHFIQNKSGTFINISSVAGLHHSPSNSVLYNSNKSAIIRFSESMNKNLSKYGIKVSCIIPCKIREDRLSEENAVSFDDVSKVALFQCSNFDNLNLQSVILEPSKTK